MTDSVHAPPAQHRALVVDDLAAERERLAGILRGAGWEVETAGSGVEAIERVRRARPNIVFMDIVMPQMDGFEACRRLASDPHTRTIPVVFVSTKNQRVDQVWARMQGGRELIGKPYTSSQVLDALRHAV